ncbi:MAG: mercuric transporter MerT family protein [Desulfuromonadales bacterium]|nr:mercuric transporter MerT family protein [Desulfuromonadales bacterium]
MITGFLASACCIGPLLLVFLGLGSAGALTTLEPYRPYMMVLTFLFLGLAFYLTYRKPKAAGCEAEGACCTNGRKRFQKTMLWIATLFALTMLFFPQILLTLLD